MTLKTKQHVMDEAMLEKYSSAISLSDMEIFVFPELMYSLVLANIMSPILWRWREEGTFKKLAGKSPYRRLMRLKQYIMDEFDFNLDLETWGLTDKDTELERFSPFLSPEEIGASNALFGYHGDQYYFDVDIRRHFGLDKYNSDIIPYWKTETLEGMNAFALKEHYPKPAGECVSLAALYAAAAYVVCDIPLDDIFMILTPLHSQNFLDLQGGVITNNRRLVTKAMWFNGTEITLKAQRALRNENVTIVAHHSGYIHCLYDEATIDPIRYDRFCQRLQGYLHTELTLSVFASFLRMSTQYQKHFQVCRNCHGHAQFLKAETLFAYEHGSNYRVGDETFEKLLAEVSDEDYRCYEYPQRIRCDRLNGFLNKKKPNLSKQVDRTLLVRLLGEVIDDAEQLVNELTEYVTLEPRLPAPDKTFVNGAPLPLTPGMSREEVITTLSTFREANITVDLAFYAYRDMTQCDWRPFIKTAMERNPVALAQTEDLSPEQTYAWLQGLPSESIYDGSRLAQPDEVVNFLTGDGLEKAFVLAKVLRARQPESDVAISVKGESVEIRVGKGEIYAFQSTKGLTQQIVICASGDITI
ncbi:hypothetical protein ACFL6U_19970 [Planctomycetota bacterium]